MKKEEAQTMRLNQLNGPSKDLLNSLQEPEFCDVRIEGITEGEEPIQANKVILSIRSQYFRSMFSSTNNFAESRRSTVKMPFPTSVLKKVIIYLYSGEMKCEDMDLKFLLELLRLLNMMNHTDEFTEVQTYTIFKIRLGGFSVGKCLESLDFGAWSLESGLEAVGKTLWTALGNNFVRIIRYIPELGGLSEKSIIRLLKEKSEDTTKTFHRFKILSIWLERNSMDTDMTDEVLRLFDFDHFTIEELVSDVRKSGLYDTNMIFERIEKIYKDKEKKSEDRKELLKSCMEEADLPDWLVDAIVDS